MHEATTHWTRTSSTFLLPRLLAVAAVSFLVGCSGAAGTDADGPRTKSSSKGTGKENLRCTGLIAQRGKSSVPGMVTDRYTAVFESDVPYEPRTLSKVTYDAEPRTVFNFANDGLTAIVTHDSGWKITNLEIAVSSNQLVLPGKTTKCPNKIIDKK